MVEEGSSLTRAQKSIEGEVDRPRNRLCRVMLCNELQLGASSRRGLLSRIRIAVSRFAATQKEEGRYRRKDQGSVSLEMTSAMGFKKIKKDTWSMYG